MRYFIEKNKSYMDSNGGIHNSTDYKMINIDVPLRINERIQGGIIIDINYDFDKEGIYAKVIVQ